MIMFKLLIRKVRRVYCKHNKDKLVYTKVGDYHILTCTNCLKQVISKGE